MIKFPKLPSTIAIIVGASLLLGACIPPFTQSNQDSTSTTTAPEETTASVNIADINNLSQLGQAMMTGKSVRCETEAEAAEQAVYVMKDGKFKGTYLDPETNTYSYVVMMDNTGYVWNDGEDTGFTYSVNPEEFQDIANSVDEMTQDLPDSVAEEIDQEEPAINCTATNIDDSEFDLPENVTFMSPEEMMQQAFDEANTETPNGENQNNSEEMSPEEMEMSEEQRQQMESMFESMQN